MRNFTQKRRAGAINTIENMLHTARGTHLACIHKIFHTGMTHQVKITVRTGRSVGGIIRVKEKECEFTKLLQSTATNFVDIDETLAPMAPLSKSSATARIDPALLYAKLQKYFCGWCHSKAQRRRKTGGYGSCAYFIVTATNAHLESTKVNVAKYLGMNNRVEAALALGAEALVIVGDSKFAIQQSLGVIACRNEALMVQLNYHKEITKKFKSAKYLHLLREFNAAADSLATEALESKTPKVVLSESRKTELSNLNRIQEMIYDSAADSI
ncbi:LOW QUALITY PROTEIN: hypothetical protein PHMEG_0009120 [Phytophthora megakarya]|uniref:RNase H type-1 domain-containing protein n=1 Tax=Phytophthora megakarya TaxID=4795 RepID=A0A225WGZ1_9STRA|nr:LOW QUALITY PROTEIN: hypothetical protein PHMEG_0009120 [Phytophthora megakarya]